MAEVCALLYVASYSLWLTVIPPGKSVFLIKEAEFHHSADQIMAPFQTSVDGWAEQLLKLGYEKESTLKNQS